MIQWWVLATWPFWAYLPYVHPHLQDVVLVVCKRLRFSRSLWGEVWTAAKLLFRILHMVLLHLQHLSAHVTQRMGECSIYTRKISKGNQKWCATSNLGENHRMEFAILPSRWISANRADHQYIGLMTYITTKVNLMPTWGSDEYQHNLAMYNRGFQRLGPQHAKLVTMGKPMQKPMVSMGFD